MEVISWRSERMACVDCSVACWTVFDILSSSASNREREWAWSAWRWSIAFHISCWPVDNSLRRVVGGGSAPVMAGGQREHQCSLSGDSRGGYGKLREKKLQILLIPKVNS
ncbi:hypothetical protein KSP39_PZI006441 [Platanthera zijinensis]|uniref:Uncharacterized protein n=1 Tax=Platanthera zijinensis TaxID=2320716 RepID=A0AAP0BQ91_9ASPA